MNFVFQILVALCLAIVVEGMLYAAFPGLMKRVVAEVLRLPEGQVRIAGLIAAAAGICVLWLLLG